LQKYPKVYRKYLGLLHQWIGSYLDDWGDEVVTADWMYRVKEETDEGRQLMGKIGLLKKGWRRGQRRW
jgi:hypothetical protein